MDVRDAIDSSMGFPVIVAEFSAVHYVARKSFFTKRM